MPVNFTKNGLEWMISCDYVLFDSDSLKTLLSMINFTLKKIIIIKSRYKLEIFKRSLSLNEKISNFKKSKNIRKYLRRSRLESCVL